MKILQTNDISEKNKFLNDNRNEIIFLIKEGIKVDDFLLKEYEVLLKKYDIPIVLYGYHQMNNRLFNKTPNPIARIKTKDRTIVLNRYVCDAVVGINTPMIPKDLQFDENLKHLYLDYFIYNTTFKEFFGFFFDIDESEKYVEENEEEITEQLYFERMNELKKEKNYLMEKKVHIANSMNLDTIIGLIKEKE